MVPTYTMLPARVKDACRHLSPDGDSVSAHTAVTLLTMHQRVIADLVGTLVAAGLPQTAMEVLRGSSSQENMEAAARADAKELLAHNTNE